MCVDKTHQEYGFQKWKNKFDAEIAEGNINGKKIMLVKPQTFMNDSGIAIGQIARFYKIEVEDVVVIHDEIDLQAGDVRTKKGGGNAGHNGLKSIDQHIGNNYNRIRIGVGHPGDRDKVSSHVLGDFSKEDEEWLNETINNVARNIKKFTEGEI